MLRYRLYQEKERSDQNGRMNHIKEREENVNHIMIVF